jgi:hypothetical protein
VVGEELRDVAVGLGGVVEAATVVLVHAVAPLVGGAPPPRRCWRNRSRPGTC